MNSIIRDRIKRQIYGHDIVLYIKGDAAFPRCASSAAAVQFLSQIGVPFKDYDILTDSPLAQGILSYTGRNGTPLLFVRGDFVADIDKLRTMHDSGELRQLVQPPKN